MKTIKMEQDGSTGDHSNDEEQEHLILSRLNNDNIIKFYEHFVEDRYGFKWLCIVTEYCPVITQNNRFTYIFIF